ncbi:GNAT family N-acetyltransferase [Streptomyces antimicrobicus]|uniref:GNAT family N-acetyltransferase n=1 Tax=Streptomyces antimicrobicus TaxID=2883108 RepID=A0ABS8BCI0_9ACTN|nr:GNAT family protein [Streptomyces antimicrobicus]MCB5182344.1 GNAT family N-acetyltransferase [Streptomyces antimicrobicus]
MIISEGVELRGVRLEDAGGLAEVLRRNRANMGAVEPERPESFYTEAGQRERIEAQLAEQEAGQLAPFVLVDTASGEPVGAINLGRITRGPFCSGGVGYWVDAARRGQGLATYAVDAVCRIARDELGLHRVEAGTLLDNVASQRVLTKAGFVEFGVAPNYLHINGAWRDHRLFQRLLHDDPPIR